MSANPAPIVAVIDTGFSLDHVNLASRWALNAGETKGSLKDNDGDGYAGNWRGWDFVHGTAEPAVGQDNPAASAATHGTLTAGLAGLLNPAAKILPLQALDDNGSGYTDAVAAAIRYAADHGAKIISLSLGSPSDDPYLHAQITYAISKGALVVAAAGNDGCDCLLYPAAYPEVLAVGASTASDTPASFSSYGRNLDVLAPGTAGDVCSSFYSPANATSAYSCGFSGTSFAAPIVAGLAALLLQINPSASYTDITSAIDLSADKIPSMLAQPKSLQAGYGRIDVVRAANSIQALLSAPIGQSVSHSIVNLTSNTLINGPQMDSTCISNPGAVCSLKLIGPQGQTVEVGQQILDPVTGGTVFYWNAANLGLTAGQWQVLITVSFNGQFASAATELITVSP